MTKNALLASTASLILLVMTVCFGFDSSDLDDRARESLDTIVSQIDSLDDYTVHLSGHTDNTGSDAYNDKLAAERAIAVKHYLISKKIDSTKIIIDSYGEHEPTVPNTSEDNRALNRRVEVTVSGQKPTPAPQAITAAEQPKQETLNLQKQDSETIIPAEKELKKKKVRRRLVWTGWRTGFHWSTSKR